MSDYTFSPVTKHDLPMLADWLKAPELQKWWGPVEKELSLIEQDLEDPTVQQNLVSFQGTPFAYIQDYCILDWPQDYFAPFPPTTRAVDTFVGINDWIGQGHGGKYIRQHINQLLNDGAERVVIDPYVENERAISAYKRAGFEVVDEFETDEGLILLMATPII